MLPDDEEKFRLTVEQMSFGDNFRVADNP